MLYNFGIHFTFKFQEDIMPTYWSMRSVSCRPALVIAALTFLMFTSNSNCMPAQIPIPRVGDSCPTGTYKSGDYCKPFKTSSTDSEQTIIQKQGSDCPTGYYKTGDYCKQYSSGSDREAIPIAGITS